MIVMCCVSVTFSVPRALSHCAKIEFDEFVQWSDAQMGAAGSGFKVQGPVTILKRHPIDPFTSRAFSLPRPAASLQNLKLNAKL